MRTGLLNLYITLVMLMTMFAYMGRSSPVSTQVPMDGVEIRRDQVEAIMDEPKVSAKATINELIITDSIISMVTSLIIEEGKPTKKNIESAIKTILEEVSVGESLVETLHLACSSCLEDDCTASCSFGNKVGKE